MIERMTRLMSLGIVLCAVLSCAGLDTTGTMDGGRPESHSADIPGIKTGIEYLNRGLKNEMRYHYVEVRGNRIPDIFNAVTIDSITYSFMAGKTGTADTGYILMPQPSEPLSGNGVFTDDDKKRGWYESAYRKIGTPESWIFAIRGSLEIFFNPYRIQELIVAFQLRPIR